jgi:hypothetical protein
MARSLRDEKRPVLHVICGLLGEYLTSFKKVDDIHAERAFIGISDDHKVRVKSVEGLVNASRFISGDPHTELSLLYHI